MGLQRMEKLTAKILTYQLRNQVKCLCCNSTYGSSQKQSGSDEGPRDLVLDSREEESEVTALHCIDSKTSPISSKEGRSAGLEC